MALTQNVSSIPCSAGSTYIGFMYQFSILASEKIRGQSFAPGGGTELVSATVYSILGPT